MHCSSIYFSTFILFIHTYNITYYTQSVVQAFLKEPKYILFRLNTNVKRY